MVGTKEASHILWVDDDPHVLEAAERLLRKPEFDFKGCTSHLPALKLLETGNFSVVVADQKMAEGSGIELLERAKTVSPTTTRILLTGSIDRALLADAVNRASVFRFVRKPWDPTELVLDIRKSVEHHRLKQIQSNLLREVSRQNRELEKLTLGLEKTVTERTLKEEQSKLAVEAQLQRVRDLVRFVKELTLFSSVDEIVDLLRLELKRFHEVRGPILGYLNFENSRRLLYFQGKQVFERAPHSAWPVSVRMRIAELDDRNYLVQEFGRPFARVVAFPLHRHRGALGAEQAAAAVLFFEHDLAESDLDVFIDFVSERIQPLSIALDRALLEDHLRYSAYQWESTFDGIKDPIAIVDMDFQLVRANRQFSERSLERTCHRVFNALEAPCQGCPALSALNTKKPQRAKVRRGNRVFDVYSYPIHLEGDSYSTNVINHYIDVTAARDLQGRVVQNEKIAAIGLLAGNIAHELNNPLTGIRSLAQVIRAELPETSQVAQDLTEVESASERCQKIIANLLEFSRGIDQTSEVILINEMVQKTLPMLKTALREHASEVNLSEDKLYVWGEPHLLQQVIFNLVNNACQAMQQTGTVEIRTHSTTDSVGKKFAEIEIRDTGEGIALEHLETIFEPFYTTKAAGQGTGLGLSMSRSIIQKFGGDISVQSQLGQGSTFTVRLPLADNGGE